MFASTGQIQTVLGPVTAEDLGATHAHEHLIAHPPAWVTQDAPDLDLGDGDPVLVDLEAFRSAGGGAIVEMTTVDYGRDAGALAELSRRSGVHVISATGFNQDIYAEAIIGDSTLEAIVERQIADVRDGADGTDARCGVVKFATGTDGASDVDRVAAAAAAATHRATGAPILTHTQAGQHAPAQLELMRAHGVPATAVTLGHLDRNPDLGLYRELTSAGAFISLDSIPKTKYATEESSIKLILALARENLHQQVVIGGDFARRSMFTGYGGAPGLTYLLTVFAPRLRDAAERADLDGDALIDCVLRTNPARALTFRAAAA